MSFSSNFLNLIIDSNCDLSVKSKYLDEGRHFNYFNSIKDNKQVEQIKQKINSLLSLYNKRSEGFVLLSRYLNECSHLIVLNESVSWATACLQSATSKNTFEKQHAFICLKKIFTAAGNSPEIYRMLSGTVVVQFIDLLPQMKIDHVDLQTANEFSSCFEICLKTFKGPCCSRRKTIEEFILSLSNSSNFLILAKSFALLAFTGSNKQLQTNNSFNQSMIMCIYTLDTLLDSNLNETHHLTYYSNIKERPLVELQNVGRMEKTLDFLRKFKFFCSVIQNLLDEPFEGLVKIPNTLLLNLIQRVVGLRINKTQTTANLESILNSNIVPAMYTSVLLLLNQLITTCSTHLSTSLREINKIMMNLLDHFNEQEKEFLIEIKSLWYSVLTNLFNKLGSHITVLISKQWQELIIDHFFADIHMKRDDLELQNKKQMTNERSSNTKFTDNSNFTNKDLLLCSQACKLMDSFLINFSKLINPKRFHKFIYQLITLIQDLYRIDLWRKLTYFVDPILRLSLLKVFRNCIITFINTSLLNNSIVLLNTVLKLDKSSEILLFAKETLIIINSPRNKIYHSTHDVGHDLMISHSTDQQQLNSVRPLSVEQTQIEQNNVTYDLNSESSDKTQDRITYDQAISEPQTEKDVENQLGNDSESESNNECQDDLLADKVSDEKTKNQAITASDDHLADKSIDKNVVEVLTNNESSNKETMDADQISKENTPLKRTVRSKKQTNEEPINVTSTRLTRSVKKKLELNEQQQTKKQKTEIEQNENLSEKEAVIIEESDDEDILKDFVDA